MPPAARLGDLHTCPKVPPGGAVIEGASSVLIEGRPAARQNDACACADGPSHVGSGSRGVLIEDQPAARLGDTTCHHGILLLGAATVMIGDAGPSSAAPAAPTSAMTRARANGAPFLRG
jgi:uncharacterized Zn-binding protein involved in type VI secretion